MRTVLAAPRGASCLLSAGAGLNRRGFGCAATARQGRDLLIPHQLRVSLLASSPLIDANLSIPVLVQPSGGGAEVADALLGWLWTS